MFQSQAASGAAASAGGNSSAPTRLRIAQNWVMLTESSGRSLQPLTVISFLPDICPFEGGRPGAGTFLEEAEGPGVEESLLMGWPYIPSLCLHSPRQAPHLRPPPHPRLRCPHLSAHQLPSCRGSGQPCDSPLTS